MTDVAGMVREYIQSECLVEFGKNDLSESTNLFDKGVMDSYSLVQMVGFLESKFGIRIGDDDLMSPKLASVEGIVDLVEDIRRREGA